tara:strand:- start:6990 stop:7844 length:855 start_codon:yes stop_codon:yes gene_type:complete
MGFLNEEEVGALGEFLSSEEDFSQEQETAPEEEFQAESSEPTEDVNEHVETGEEALEAHEPEEAYSASEEEEHTPGHRVPYDRFKQVLEARNGYKGEIDYLRAQMEELQGQLDTRQQTPAAAPQAAQKSDEDQWLDNLLEEPDPQAAAAPHFKAMEDRMYQQEVQMAGYELQGELAQAEAAFPGVPREVMLNAVANDPNVTAMEVAEGYSSWVADIEEAALADYIAANPGADISEVVDPVQEVRRPARAGATETTVSHDAPQPASVKEGSDMLRAYMKKHNPFV